MLFVSWELMSGLGWGDVSIRSLAGRLVCVYLSAVGIVCVAMLTATFYSLSELGATEGTLIKAIERRSLGRAERDAAVRLIQTWARRLLARLREDESMGSLLGSLSKRLSGVKRLSFSSPVMKRGSGVGSTSTRIT